MKKSLGAAERVGKLLYGNGWGFLIPYFALYLPALWLSASPVTLKSLYWCLHGGLFVGAIFFTRNKLQTVARPEIGFWVLLFLFFWVPGAYLEYPGDPWEHVLRFFTWERASSIRDSAYPFRLSYFLGWTLLSPLPVQWVRPGLDLYSAFWQWLVCVQLFRLLIRLGLSRTQGLASVAVFSVAFGTNVFGLRYYALGNFTLGYVVYLGALSLLAKPGGWRAWVGAIGIGLLLQYVHRQEVFLLLLFGPALVLAKAFSGMDGRRQRQIGIGFGLLFLIGLAIGPWLMTLRDVYVMGYGREFFTSLGTLKAWYRPIRHTDTLGVHGILGLLFAIRYFRLYPVISILTLLPLFLTLFPPFVYFLTFRMTDASDTYRLYYGFPTAVFLVLGAEEALKRVRVFSQSPSRPLAGATALALILCLPWTPSWRGRARFQVHLNDPRRALVPLDETAQWLAIHRPDLKRCPFIADDVTTFGVSALLGYPMISAQGQYNWRLEPNFFGKRLDDTQAILEATAKYQACGVLALRRDLWTSPPPSWISRESGHWGHQYGDIAWYSSPAFEQAASRLPGRGWTKTPVPPFFWLYEPK